MIDAAGNPPPGFAPAQRGIGLGVCSHQRGRTVQSETIMLIHFDTPKDPRQPWLARR
jgi:hypothetical protein